VLVKGHYVFVYSLKVLGQDQPLLALKQTHLMISQACHPLVPLFFQTAFLSYFAKLK